MRPQGWRWRDVLGRCADDVVEKTKDPFFKQWGRLIEEEISARREKDGSGVIDGWHVLAEIDQVVEDLKILLFHWFQAEHGITGRDVVIGFFLHIQIQSIDQMQNTIDQFIVEGHQHVLPFKDRIGRRIEFLRTTMKDAGEGEGIAHLHRYDTEDGLPERKVILIGDRLADRQQRFGIRLIVVDLLFHERFQRMRTAADQCLSD